MTHLTPPDISLKALIRLAGPIWIANISIIGSGTIDTIMAGMLGKEHLAAIALGLNATLLVNLALVGILQSLSPIAGHHFGAKEYHKIGDEVQQSMWLGIFLSLIGMPILLSTDMWIAFGQVHGEVARMAAGYMTFTALTMPFALFTRTFVSLNAALSRPNITMWISLGMLVLKAPLNAIFMYGWFGLPEMGGMGAGLSFGLANVFSFLLFFAIWKLDPFYKRFASKKFHLPNWSLIKEQLHIGIPIGLSTFFEVSSFTGMAIFISRFGAATVSAHQIVANITSMCYMLPLSIGIATSVLVSQSLGARWQGIAYVALKRGLRYALIVSAIIVGVLFFARRGIVSLYTNDASVIATGAAILIFACCYHLFDAMQCVGAFALRGYRITKLPMMIYGLMLWCVGLGGGYYLGFHGEAFGGPYGVYGFWGATAAGLVLTGITICTMALVVGRNKAKEDNHSEQEIAQALRA